ncbi:MAG: hydroxyisourate hydrolase [Ktedonobacteraceae bacterium]|nr:hydroxyisourate hydrolase [Ktedonobacteraceae bacterium]
MEGRLTTHVLDTVHGCPAAGMLIDLWRLEPTQTQDVQRVHLKTMRTNADGQVDEPLLADEELTAGVYELVFAVGAYFNAQPVTTTLPPFLDSVPVRFGITDPTAHYHIPLLISPWAYSTYRGS